MSTPHATVYRFGRQIWIVPQELVTTQFTAAYNKIVNTSRGMPEQLTEQELAAFAAVNDSGQIYIIET